MSEELNLDNCVGNWDIRRQDESKVKTDLAYGNRFSFSLENEITERTHAYIGWDESESKMCMFLIKAVNDIGSNDSYDAVAYLQKNMVDPSSEKSLADTDQLGNQEARTRIDRYSNPSNQQNWIDQQFEYPQSIAIFQVFVIHAEDFDLGTDFDVYLAFKEEVTTPPYWNNYQPEVILAYNGNGNESVAASNMTYMDVTVPVPPFKPQVNGQGQSSTRYMPNFGLLAKLGIN